MLHTTLATATDIQNWANRIDARVHLPHLIRRLIQHSTTDLQHLSMRTGEGIQLPGWDGVTESISGSAFVPSGATAWEIGTNADITSKAKDDYTKRTTDSEGINPKETTYMFITPRRWSGKDNWVKNRLKEKVWKNVRALDADDLHAWLETVPAVHIWFSQLIGRVPDGAETLESFATEWLGVTQPPMPEALVTSGRSKEVNTVVERLRDTPNVLSVKATSRTEAVVFLFAVLSQLEEPYRTQQLERAVIVRNRHAWQTLVSADKGLILIPFSDDIETAASASRHGHHVYIPLESDNGDFDLPLLQRAPVEKLLLDTGLSEEKARKLSQTARRSLSALRRQLSPARGIANPEWSRTPNPALLAAMLVGEWDGSNTHDQQILEQLSGVAYADLERTLLELKQLKDPPVRQRGRDWMIAVKPDAWMLLSPLITRHLLEKFRAVVSSVLEVIDPALELPKDQRMMASLLKKVIPHSYKLRSGLADTLAVMGAYSDQITFADGTRGQEEADITIRKLLHDAPLERWTSLGGLFPLLAEASPTQFLGALERQPQSLLTGFFTDSDGTDIWGMTSPHTYILWALEGLAWHSEYLSRAASLLLRLHKLDPGGRTTNRPMDSLSRIFLLWLPCTTASLRERLDILEALTTRDQEAIWRLRRTILPQSTTFTHQTSKPKHRPWLDDFQRSVTIRDVVEGAQETIAQLVQRASLQVQPWVSLLELLSRVDVPDACEMILTAFEQLEPSRFATEDCRLLWGAIEETVARHREFPEAEWALDPASIDSLEQVGLRFRPNDLVQVSLELFSQHPLHLHWNKHANEAWAMVTEDRRQRLEEIHKQGGMEAIDELIRGSKEPMWIGHGLAQTNLIAAVEAEYLERHINSEDSAFRQMARYYVSERNIARGTAWLERFLTEVLPKWNAEQQASFLSSLRFEQLVWRHAKMLGEDVNRLYWKTTITFYPSEPLEIECAIEELLAVDRPVSALHILSMAKHDQIIQNLDPALSVRVLQACLTTQSTDEAKSLRAYDVGKILDFLDTNPSVARDVLARLEFALLPLFRFDRRQPRTLHNELATSPRFFAELIEIIYKPESGAERNISEQDIQFARVAHQLLDGWRHIPGSIQNENGTDIDDESLRTWITTAQAETEVRDRK
ncbi:MAG: hypothetical protein RLZZ156_1680, partial [Deinococcota bacterium]